MVFLLDCIAISVVRPCIERSSLALQLRVSQTVDGSWYMDVGRTPSIEFDSWYINGRRSNTCTFMSAPRSEFAASLERNSFLDFNFGLSKMLMC